MELWTHDRARFPLPPRHRFPIAMYPLLRRRVLELGLATPGEIHETEPVPWALLERVHEGELLRRIRAGERATPTTSRRSITRSTPRSTAHRPRSRSTSPERTRGRATALAGSP